MKQRHPVHDNLGGQPVTECQTVLNFAVVADEGGGNANCNFKEEQSQKAYEHSAFTGRMSFPSPK